MINQSNVLYETQRSYLGTSRLSKLKIYDNYIYISQKEECFVKKLYLHRANINNMTWYGMEWSLLGCRIGWFSSMFCNTMTFCDTDYINR